ncbi:MAG: DUF362 domain-containing protein [Chitinispirillaceae bacterium]|nr:DUF362 domain-containing protein [Chitinispirillaceae bacterium]
MGKSRRNFLKISAAGSVGLAVAGMTRASEGSSGGWTNGKKINPAIDNLRAVCCYDQRMVKSTPTSWSFDNQNNAINTPVVQANLDAMALALTQKPTAAEAWGTIFQKSPAKQWSQVRVAVKVNCINSQNMHRLAIIDKIARELIALGVQAQNIVIYDGDDNASGSGKYSAASSLAKLPPGIVVSNLSSALNGTMSTPVPNLNNANCTTDIANGTIDILINCALNKGHRAEHGTATLSMKNHYGTFAPGCRLSNTTEYLLAINKSSAILGGTPVRQQLCIIDSLFASIGGPVVTPDKVPYRIAMGTFGPALDYLTVKRIREPVMGATHNATVVNRFLTDFGYQTSQVTDFINVAPVGIKQLEAVLKAMPHTLLFDLQSGRFHPASVDFTVLGGESAKSIIVYDMKGHKVRSFDSVRGQITLWDGFSDGGVPVASGLYLVRIETGKRSLAEKMHVTAK